MEGFRRELGGFFRRILCNLIGLKVRAYRIQTPVAMAAGVRFRDVFGRSVGCARLRALERLQIVSTMT